MEVKMKILSRLLLVWGLSTALVWAGEDGKDLKEATYLEPSLELRPEPYVAIFGGANVHQWSDAAGYRSDIGGVGGLKFGAELKNLFSLGATEDHDWLYPALEFETFYNGFSYHSGGALGNSSDVHSAVFSLNPLLKSRWGGFKVYIGGGLGGAYVSSENSVGGDKDDFVLAPQATGGMEYSFDQHWSILTEYKYLHFFDADVTPVGAADIGQHIVVGGLKYSF
jgi:opacity protein-like surface antigen